MPARPKPKGRDAAKRRRSNFAYHLRVTYGISIELYELMLAAQDGRCYICQRKSAKHLSVDHDHTCCPGKKTCGNCIRGLLCQGCNWDLLGQICQETKRGREHAIQVLERALGYLKAGSVHDVDALRRGLEPGQAEGLEQG